MSPAAALRPIASRMASIRTFATYIPEKCRARTAVAAVYLTAALTVPFIPPVLETRRVRLEGVPEGTQPLEWKVNCPQGRC